jgi:myo-inositol-1(or 4)-monophosphatase
MALPDMTPTDMTLTDPELAVAAALAGAEVVRAGYGLDLFRYEKSPGDFATQADLDAEAAIRAVLRRARPADAVLGEETGLSGRTGAGRIWLVDPLCGTLNYAARTMLVAVNVALRVDGVVTAAAVADPFGDEVFWTDGSGAYRGDGEPLRPDAHSGLVDVNLDPVGDTPPDRAAALISDRDFLTWFRPRVLSTTLALTLVAAGRRAAYVTDGDVRGSVHFAAGLAVCRAAGCVVTGLDGQPGGDGLLVAADAVTHAILISLLAGTSPRTG